MDISKVFSVPVISELAQISARPSKNLFVSCSFNKKALVSSVLFCGKSLEKAVLAENVKAIVVFRHFPFKSNDSEIASVCVSKNLGFIVVDFEKNECSVVVEADFDDFELIPISIEKCTDVLAKGGSLSKLFSDYEERPGQIALVREIAKTFNEDSIGVFEAGTGVGKSFAYLIPSILWAKTNHERVVISTGTINLQQQLIEKDIPLAKRVLGVDFVAVLAKGRANFVCLRRLSELAENRELFGSETEVFDKLWHWSKKTKSGDKSDLPFTIHEGLWQRICSESDACLGSRCQFFEKCFVMKMRKSTNNADIIIVNHHLLFADVSARLAGAGFDGSVVLPPYNRVVFDEAHGIESSATSFFSEIVHRFRLQKQLSLLYKRRRSSVSGFMFTLCAISLGEDRTEDLEIEIENLNKSFKKMESEADSFLGKENSARICEKNEGDFKKVLEEMENVCESIVKIAKIVNDTIEEIDESEKDESVVWESRSVVRKLESFATVFKNYAERHEHSDFVFWIQRSRLPDSMIGADDFPFFVQFCQTPLDISDLMNEGIFSPLSSVVFTSATLSISNDFSFWKNRIGVSKVSDKKIICKTFDSPFPYSKNAILTVPFDSPFPDQINFFAFVQDALFRLIKNAGGRTLVLFTSYELLRSSFDFVKQKLNPSEIPLFKQGDDDRFKLLEKFKNDTKSVLFATDSFWEGVDVPGKSLSQVVIVKLPFSVPSDPVFAARSEVLEGEGKSAFFELSVPEAIIKFRQGFGRLIRRGNDKGAVVVLDKRLFEKRYGQKFLNSIPKTPCYYKTLSKILVEIKNFL